MAPAFKPSTRSSRAAILSKNRESAIFQYESTPRGASSRDLRKPPLPPQVVSGRRTSTRASSESDLLSPLTSSRARSPRSASVRGSGRQLSASPRPNSGRYCLPSPGRSPSPRPGHDPLTRLCWDGTSDDCTGRSALWDDRAHSPVRGGHHGGMYMAGNLPKCIGQGKNRDYSPQTSMAQVLSPERRRGVDSGPVADRSKLDSDAAGQRRPRELVAAHASATGGGRQAFKDVEMREDHFLNAGVAGGDRHLRGNPRSHSFEGGLPRGIGAGKRTHHAVRMDHFDSTGTVGDHLVMPSALKGSEDKEMPSDRSGTATTSTGGMSARRDMLTHRPMTSPGKSGRTETPRSRAKREVTMRDDCAAAVEASAMRVARIPNAYNAARGPGWSPRRLLGEGSHSPRRGFGGSPTRCPAQTDAEQAAGVRAAERSNHSFQVKSAPSAPWMRWKGHDDAIPEQDSRQMATVHKTSQSKDTRRAAAGVNFQSSGVKSATRPTNHRFDLHTAAADDSTRWWTAETAPGVRAG